MKEKRALKDHKIERVVFNAITKQAVTDAMKSSRQIDGALVEKKMRTLAKLGHPYAEDDFTGAAAAVAGKTELEALIAYLQGLGTNVKPGG